MTMVSLRRNLSLFVLFLLTQGQLVTPKHVYTDSFPTNDEYDYKIMDPHMVYGSPYGGFSRATRSRLAALPLPLPGGESVSDDPFFMQVRDADGRLFACRVYHEDEIAASSLTDSMFDTVNLKGSNDDIEDLNDHEVAIDSGIKLTGDNSNEILETFEINSRGELTRVRKITVTVDANDGDSMSMATVSNDVEQTSKEGSVVGSMDETTSNTEQENIDGSITTNTMSTVEGTRNVEQENLEGLPALQGQKESEDFSTRTSKGTTDPSTGQEGAVSVQLMTSIFTKLSGICTQIHKGWWSYEWCHGEKITQFHIDLDDKPLAPGQNNVRIVDVTKLGEFTGRMFAVAPQAAETESDSENKKLGKDTGNKEPKNAGGFRAEYADGEVEIGTITDSFDNGDFCPETQSPRRSSVHYRCCSIKTMDDFGSGVLRRGKPIASNIAAVIGLEEPSVCHYMVTVCTPLLCKGLADQYEDGIHQPNAAKKSLKRPSATRPPRKDDESIREALDRVLTNVCLQKITNDWWSYEICHGLSVRQFHQNNFVDPVTGSMSKVIDAENILGIYDRIGLEEFPKEQEVDYVVNATDEVGHGDIGMTMSKVHISPQRGNGAYFKQEYIGGDLCVNNDGTDVAIKAEGGVKRATTVRFFCGPENKLSQVNEDSTCHYVMDVTIPDICHHPLFKAPVTKKQVIKCLPVHERSQVLKTRPHTT